MYAAVENGVVTQYPVTEPEIRGAFPNVSFRPGSDFATDLPAPYVLVQDVPMPVAEIFQKVDRGVPEFVDGRWVEVWVVSDKSESEKTVIFESMRQAKKLEVNIERDSRERGGFTYMGKTIDSDPISIQRIAIAVQTAQLAMAIGQGLSLDWTCADGSSLAMNEQQIMGMSPALAMYANALHVRARELKAQIDAVQYADIDTLINFDAKAFW